MEDLIKEQRYDQRHGAEPWKQGRALQFGSNVWLPAGGDVINPGVFGNVNVSNATSATYTTASDVVGG